MYFFKNNLFIPPVSPLPRTEKAAFSCARAPSVPYSLRIRLPFVSLLFIFAHPRRRHSESFFKQLTEMISILVADPGRYLLNA